MTVPNAVLISLFISVFLVDLELNFAVLEWMVLEVGN